MKKITQSLIQSLIQSIAIITLTGFLSACGGGSSNDDGSNLPNGSDVKTGQFKDSAVKGLTYETATQSGITDENGTFKYKAGEAVTFKIGAMEIGRAEGKKILYPTHITDNKAKAIKIAQVLQTLDKDNNPEKGIDIEGQFNFNSTKNEDIQQADLQTLIDGIKKTSGSLVDADKAEKHMNETIFTDTHSTFESFPTQDALDRLKISDGKLEIVPESTKANHRSIWLLAQSDSKITSMSADVRHGYEGNYASMADISLMLELKAENNIHYFSIGAYTFICSSNYCDKDGTSQGDLTVTVGGSQSRGDYLGKIIKTVPAGYIYDKQENIVPYVGDKLESFATSGMVGGFTDYKFSIELDKQNKKVHVTKGNLSGSFDISDTVFGNLDNASAKFFIKYYSTNKGGISRNDGSIVPFNPSYVDNVKINNQDFDDFSATTLDTTKWKTGKFSHSINNDSIANPAFEFVSNQKDISSRISIDNGRLKLSPQTSESVWLLAKNATKITSLSIDVKFNSGIYSYLGPVLELRQANKIHYFRIVIMHTGSPCPPDAGGCTSQAVDRVAVNSLYLGELPTKYIFSGLTSNDKPNYTVSTLAKDKDLYYDDNIAASATFSANLTIAFDKNNKKVVVKHGNELGHFDISNLFSDFNQVQSKFFINMHNRAFNENNKPAFVDNIKINDQDFDDFSATTLDTNKWKIGKFPYLGE